MMPSSAELLDRFRRDRARGTNDDVDLTLRPAYRDLLAKLGDPHKKLPPVFHVAGTNGKGSTCAFLRAILEAAGFRVHVYTSPHLVTFHERIRIAGKLIDEDELVEWLTLCDRLAPPQAVTFFEAATAVAFAAFVRHPADFTIVEVGLGGRLDATNVIPKPLASIITRLSFDHRDYLGNSMKEIAGEKAGIMREGIPCFAAHQPDADAVKTLRDTALKLRAPFYVAGEDWKIQKTDSGFSYNSKTANFDLPPPALCGAHQYDNAGLAIAALLGAGVRIMPEDIARGLRNVEWPARLQHLKQGFLPRLMPPDSELWLDGGHNDSAGDVLAAQAKIWAEDKKPLHMIGGMLTTKKPAEFLAPLQPYSESFHGVPIPDEAASYSAEDLADAARACGMKNVRAAKNVEAALHEISAAAKEPVRILICGSLYLAGHVLNINQVKDSH